MLEAFVIAFIAVSGAGSLSEGTGGHVEATPPANVAVMSERTGKVLYYNVRR